MPKLTGTIYRKMTKERIPDATVKATKKNEIKYERTDEDGNFAFDDIVPGSWSVVALHEGSFPSIKETIELMEDKSDFNFYLPRIGGEEDSKSGKILFWVQVGLLISLIITYVLVHVLFPIGTSNKFQFWVDNPLRYIEIILWGFGGILVNKIITVGWYLRGQRFYREGIIMHISHLLVTPLMVLVVTLLLSLVTLDVTLAGNSLTLDLSKPEVLISFAFILGASPWPLWNFIEDAGKRFTENKEKK